MRDVQLGNARVTCDQLRALLEPGVDASQMRQFRSGNRLSKATIGQLFDAISKENLALNRQGGPSKAVMLWLWSGFLHFGGDMPPQVQHKLFTIAQEQATGKNGPIWKLYKAAQNIASGRAKGDFDAAAAFSAVTGDQVSTEQQLAQAQQRLAQSQKELQSAKIIISMQGMATQRRGQQLDSLRYGCFASTSSVAAYDLQPDQLSCLAAMKGPTMTSS